MNQNSVVIHITRLVEPRARSVAILAMVCGITRKQEIARARRLNRSGRSHAEIARRIGVSRSTIAKWLAPQAASEWNRRSNAKRKDYKREWARTHKRLCNICGNERGNHKIKEARCNACRLKADRAARDERRSIIIALWGAGARVVEIAAELSSTAGSVRVEIARMRREGIAVPYRSPERRPKNRLRG